MIKETTLLTPIQVFLLVGFREHGDEAFVIPDLILRTAAHTSSFPEGTDLCEFLGLLCKTPIRKSSLFGGGGPLRI